LAVACFLFCLVGLASDLGLRPASADVVTLSASRDNTLFQYDPADPNDSLNSNGIGNFFSAGCTFSRSEIQRGLLAFDFSGIPDGAVVADVALDLYVVDVPRRDTTPRPFWVVALPQLERPWGEGASFADINVSGSGSGAPAQPGDATWLHTQYDPAIHGVPPAPPLGTLAPFVPDGPGFWPELGAVGDGPFVLTDAPAGIAGEDLGPVTFSSPSMIADVQGWLDDPSTNFGWLLVGDESIVSSDASTKRGFASREHANPDWHPQLTVQYQMGPVAAVPEPASGLLALLAAVGFAAFARRRIRRPRR